MSFLHSHNVDPIDIYPEMCSDHELLSIVDVEAFHIDKCDLDRWLVQHKSKAEYSRLLRYFLSSLILSLDNNDTVLDVGSGDYRYSSVVGHLVKEVLSNDIILDDGDKMKVRFLEGSIFDIDLTEYNITKIVVGHTFEHFRGDNDIRFIGLLGKILPKGGRCCIEPIFIGKRYLEIFNYESGEKYDPASIKIVTKDSNFPGDREYNMGFARVYDSASLHSRVISVAEEAELGCKIFSLMLEGQYLLDMNKYAFKRASINYPIRMLLIERR